MKRCRFGEARLVKKQSEKNELVGDDEHHSLPLDWREMHLTGLIKIDAEETVARLNKG